MATANPYFDVAADVGSENESGEEEEYNEEGQPTERHRRRKENGVTHDSSEEEDEDEDEAAAREVAEGFIADEDDIDEEERRERRRERKKRKREERENEALDEEDLEIAGLVTEQPDEQSKVYKRLKRGHKDDRQRGETRGVEDIFDDEDVEDRRGLREAFADDIDDFIEEDVMSDDEMRDEAEVRRPARHGFIDPLKLKSGMDEAAQEDMAAAFGDGTEYDWALQMQEEGDLEQEDPDKPLELKDVFEPSQLVDKMLTEDDNIIRFTDIPERYQLARKSFKEQDLSEQEMEEQIKEEAAWICALTLPKRRLDSDMIKPFEEGVRHVLRFMNIENLEIPFIAQNRKDYLIHEERLPVSPGHEEPGKPDYEIRATRMLQNHDLWELYELDLKWRSLVEKRNALRSAYENLKSRDVEDGIFDEMIPEAQIMEELQDLQDYLHFQYAAQIKDAAIVDGETNGVNGTNGTKKRARSTRNAWDRVRAGRAYHMVKAFGISADALAQNALKVGKKAYTEDPTERPDDMADGLVDADEFATGQQVLQAAKAMYAEELAMSPRMRKYVRQSYYTDGIFDCTRTEKGLRRIDEDHPYYEFKYLKNQDFGRLVREPDLFLRMLKAEEEGLIEVSLRLQNPRSFKENLYRTIESDNVSEAADAWNILRKEVVDIALQKLSRIIVKGCKESLRTECEGKIAEKCRDQYMNKLDQAPYKPRGMVAGTVPRVLAISNGAGQRNDAICWVYVDEGGRVVENGKFTDLRMGNPEKALPDSRDIAAFVDLVENRKPDVVAVSGWSVEARKLQKTLEDIVDREKLLGTPYEDDEGNEQAERLDVEIINDETARLYYTSDRAAAEHPTLPALTRYCVALAKYLQSPLKEYISLGKDVISISFSPHQTLIPQEKVVRNLEMAMVEMVNVVGVQLEEALEDVKTANLLQYVAGLGPRKATQLLKVIHANGGQVRTRDELVGDPERSIRPAVGPKVYENCASFLYIAYDDTEPEADFLDNTRVHPEDYEIARKMVADTLELDEEDVKAEQEENGPHALVRKLVKDDAQDKLNDLILDEYSDEIYRKLGGIRKKATLELIRNDLQSPYEELRQPFYLLSTEELFTMLTGETPESLVEGMLVPISVKRTGPSSLDVKLDCGIDGVVPEDGLPEGVGFGGAEPRNIWTPHQTIQAKLTRLDRRKFTVEFSLKESDLRRPYRKEYDHEPGEWDEQQESEDKRAAAKEKESKTGRAQRVIKHPLYRPFNSAQAQEYLGSQGRGDVVIRPSSKGPDHLAVTWKVAENVYQHIDVLELDKENEFSVGRTLKVMGKYTYSDLDELIELAVKSMARKVEEMMGDERYQATSKAQTEQWLTTYTEANPKRAMYAFCIDPKHPGYFNLCFKPGRDANLSSWPVKVIPNAFELQKNAYPDMRALKNGFKLLFQNQPARGPAGMNGRR